MAHAAAPRQVTSSFQPAAVLKWTGFLLALLIGARFLIKYALPYTSFTPEVYGNYWPGRGWLALHVLSGSVALVTGPFQFWKSLRARNITLHRWLGRVYLSAILLGSIASFVVGASSHIPAFGFSLIFLGVAWLTTSSAALIAILRRQVNVHREWMIRSYVVSFGFVTFRLIGELKILDAYAPVERAIIDAWMCWAVPLLFTEVALQWRKILGPSKPAQN